MEARNTPDAKDQNILRILSFYEHFDFIELCYELDEDDAMKGRITKGELSSRLESLTAEDFVEQVSNGENSLRWASKRAEAHR
jgi:hypothetical protein